MVPFVLTAIQATTLTEVVSVFQFQIVRLISSSGTVLDALRVILHRDLLGRRCLAWIQIVKCSTARFVSIATQAITLEAVAIVLLLTLNARLIIWQMGTAQVATQVILLLPPLVFIYRLITLNAKLSQGQIAQPVTLDSTSESTVFALLLIYYASRIIWIMVHAPIATQDTPYREQPV